MPVPPASNFAGSGGGDGWGIALSQDKVYNVFHHNNVMTVACHLQADASECWSPTTVQDDDGNDFQTSAQPGMSLDQSSGKLYVYGTRSSDTTPGVVCFDTALATTDPFCGFTALTPTGQGLIYGASTLSVPMQVGHRWYAFNYVYGEGVGGEGGDGAQNKLLCFDLTTDAACTGQPFSVDLGGGTLTHRYPSPTTAAIDGRLIIPATVEGTDTLACFDAGADGDCTGSWPVTTGVPSYGNGSPFPLMDDAGAITGLCMPTGTDQCFTLSGASTPTPTGMTDVIGASSPYNGEAVVLGPRVYVPDGNVDQVRCYDYSTSAACSDFPKGFAGLGYLYTVTADPQRPTCLWVNANGGDSQIQSFDAYTGGACGSGSTRVLTSQFIVPQQDCFPTAYESLQLVEPDRSAYTSGTVEFSDGAGNPIAGIPSRPLDSTGAVDLSGLSLNTDAGLPQFLITLNGPSGDIGQLTVKLTWTDSYDPACVAPGAEVEKQATTVTTALSDGNQSGAQISVPNGTPVTDRATLSGANSSSASGTITYTWYSNSSCSSVASAGSAQQITNAGTVPASAPVNLPAGTYHVVAAYSGDDGNLASSGACADEVLTVGSVNVAPEVDPVTGPTSAAEGTTKTYSVSASDAEDDTLTYAWSITAGDAQISGPADGSSADVTFTGGPGMVTLQVIVSDGHGHSVTRTIDASRLFVPAPVTPPPPPPAAKPGKPAPPPVTVKCVSRRSVTIHIGRRYNSRLVRAVTGMVDGEKLSIRRTHGRWAIKVDMRGRDRATVRVELTVRFRHGAETSMSRAFRTCRPGT